MTKTRTLPEIPLPRIKWVMCTKVKKCVACEEWIEKGYDYLRHADRAYCYYCGREWLQHTASKLDLMAPRLAKFKTFGHRGREDSVPKFRIPRRGPDPEVITRLKEAYHKNKPLSHEDQGHLLLKWAQEDKGRGPDNQGDAQDPPEQP